jgi:ribosomal protein L37AE/L43A
MNDDKKSIICAYARGTWQCSKCVVVGAGGKEGNEGKDRKVGWLLSVDGRK